MADKIYTDNLPLLDEVVYYLKVIAEGIVLKEDELAEANETIQSIKAADLYLSCVENSVRLDRFDYTIQQLLDAGALPSNIDMYLQDYRTIPADIAKIVLKVNIEYCMNNYIEYNNYYRMIHGLPDIGQNGIKIPESYLSMIPQGYYIDISKDIHDMKSDEQDILFKFGIIKLLIQEFPTHKYLNYIGSRSIDIYKARRASQFALLYLPPEVPHEVDTRFMDKLELARVYTLDTIYSDAYKFESDYYDNFIRMFIVLQAMMDVIVELPDFMIKKDLFDLKMIKLVFESSGIDYFPEIPFKYQLAMVKNINRLIKYKATTQSIIDICTLFGCSDIKVFKYYLLKDRRLTPEGDYVYRTKEDVDIDGNPITVEDLEANYELKFLQVPIEEIADNHLQDKSAYLGYDEVVANDKYWDSTIGHDVVKEKILKEEFNYRQSKYLAIDTVYSLTDVSFQQIYFYNMLFDNKKVEELLTLSVPTIDTVSSFKLTDIICYLFSLMYIDMGIKDKLMNNMGQILTIKGFNFNANLPALATYIANKGFTLEELGVADFQIPDTSILTYEQLMYIFTKNTNIYNHVVKQMRTANNKQMYDIYKKIYDSLMLMDLTMDFFKKSDGVQATTYTEFLQDRNIILYNSLEEVRAIKDPDIKVDRINRIIGDTIYILEMYLNNVDFPYIFSNFPTVSSESIKSYIYKVINFFKSYKTQIYNINTIYEFSDKYENRINIIDGIYGRIYEYTKGDTIELIDKIINTVNIEFKDGVILHDVLYKSISTELSKYFGDKIKVDDKFRARIITLSKEERDRFIQESAELICKVFKKDTFDIQDRGEYNIKINQSDKLELVDKCYFLFTYELSRNFADYLLRKESISILVSKTESDHIGIFDNIDILVVTE